MKKDYKYILVFLMMFSFADVSAQGEFHIGGAVADESITLTEANSSVQYFDGKMYFLNTSGSDMDVLFKRSRLYHTFGWTDQICDDEVCFVLADQDIWVRPSVINVPAGDSIIFQPKVEPNDIDGCAIYEYTITTEDKTLLDKVTLTYTLTGINCFLDVEDKKEDFYSVYPNPVNSILNIEISNPENTSIAVFDITGKKVANMELANGKNQLNVESLNAGVYFYSIIVNGELKETKKLLIK